MNHLRTLLLAFLVIGFISCGNHDDSNQVQNPNLENSKVNNTDQPDKTGDVIERKIIKEGYIQFQTNDLEKTHSMIVSEVNTLKGYISKENLSTYSDNIEHQLVIRIPADQFDELLKKIASSANVESKSVEMNDVTEEYIDVNARLNTKKELEVKYKELLKQAKSVDEILNIQKEIAELQSDLESVEGRMKYLNDQIQYSTLNVTYFQKSATSFGFVGKIVPAIKDGWHGLLEFIIFIFHLWAFIIIGIVLFIWIKRRRKNRRNSTQL